jgi:hypothetical protein
MEYTQRTTLTCPNLNIGYWSYTTIITIAPLTSFFIVFPLLLVDLATYYRYRTLALLFSQLKGSYCNANGL